MSEYSLYFTYSLAWVVIYFTDLSHFPPTGSCLEFLRWLLLLISYKLWTWRNAFLPLDVFYSWCFITVVESKLKAHGENGFTATTYSNLYLCIHQPTHEIIYYASIYFPTCYLSLYALLSIHSSMSFSSHQSPDTAQKSSLFRNIQTTWQ